MQVTFTRTAERRYRVAVEGKGLTSLFMEPAAGYDERLPHDLAHFVVENMLGIMGCIYGPLSRGGGSWTPVDGSKRKAAKRGDPAKHLNQKEAEMTERVIDIACHAWTGRTYTGAPVKEASPDVIKRICTEFERVSSIWSRLPIGGSMTLEWTAK